MDFINDMEGLLRPGLNYKIYEAYEFVRIKLMEKI